MTMVNQILRSDVMLIAPAVSALSGSFPSTTAALRSARHCRRPRIYKQTRNFRVGHWSPHLGPDCLKEGQKRHRIIRHKYTEILNRGSSWDRHFPVYLRQRSLKGFMCNAWYSQAQSSGGRWGNLGKLDELSQALRGRREGIEEVEQNPVERLLRDHQARVNDLVRARSRLFGFGWGRSDSQLKNESSVSEPTKDLSNGSTSTSPTFQDPGSVSGVQQTSTNPEALYDIDPITNRRVQRSSAGKSPGPARKSIPIPDQAFRTKQSPQPSQQPCSVKEGLRDYDSRAFYGPVYYKEPDGKDPEKPCSVQTGLNNYDSRVSYGPVYYKEPDGKDPEKPCSVQEGLKDYDSRICYGPVYYKEPDGKDPEKPCSVKEGLRDYDSRASYGPVYYKEPDGKDPEKPCSVQEGLKDYDSRVSYSPVFYNEPDGREMENTCAVQKGLKDYDEKVTYEPFMDGELISKMPKTSSSAPQRFEKPATPAESRKPRLAPFPRVSDQTSTATRKGFFNRGEDQTEDLDLLRAVDVRAASGILKGPRKETDVEKSNKRRHLEEDFYRSQALDTTFSEDTATGERVKETSESIEDLKIEHSELMNHAAHARGRVEAKIAEVEAGWPRSSTSSQLSGNFARDFPEEFATKWTEKDSVTSTLTPSHYEPDVEKGEQGVKKAWADGAESNAALNSRPYSDKIQPALDRYVVSGTERLPKEEQVVGSSTIAIPAVNNNLTNGTSEPNKTSRKVQKQQHKELVREIRGIYEDTYGAIDCNHRQVPDGEGNKGAKMLVDHSLPTLYKILAYDPTMQAISEAETTSVVTDSASPLTPAEVLLRLSNPTKFFPHFAPLQSQGYEIVSGSGDVLVFRKVRSGAPPKVHETAPLARRDHLRRNPIDGMLPIAATGNFASPTGFVNHDLPESDPPFKSNIDMRREEPVFSGRSSWQDGEEPPLKSGGRGKRFLIGAAWVGACSYAVGVVAEFFKTGGMDGLGPKGF